MPVIRLVCPFDGLAGILTYPDIPSITTKEHGIDAHFDSLIDQEPERLLTSFKGLFPGLEIGKGLVKPTHLATGGGCDGLAITDPFMKLLKESVLDSPYKVRGAYYFPNSPAVHKAFNDTVTKAITGKREDIAKVLAEGAPLVSKAAE